MHRATQESATDARAAGAGDVTGPTPRTVPAARAAGRTTPPPPRRGRSVHWWLARRRDPHGRARGSGRTAGPGSCGRWSLVASRTDAGEPVAAPPRESPAGPATGATAAPRARRRHTVWGLVAA